MDSTSLPTTTRFRLRSLSLMKKPACRWLWWMIVRKVAPHSWTVESSWCRIVDSTLMTGEAWVNPWMSITIKMLESRYLLPTSSNCSTRTSESQLKESCNKNLISLCSSSLLSTLWQFKLNLWTQSSLVAWSQLWQLTVSQVKWRWSCSRWAVSL